MDIINRAIETKRLREVCTKACRTKINAIENLPTTCSSILYSLFPQTQQQGTREHSTTVFIQIHCTILSSPKPHLASIMSLVNVTNVVVLDNPTQFTNPFQFEITFECLQDLNEGMRQPNISS